MFLGQPEHTPYDVKFHLLGFPIRIHPWFWIMAIFLGANTGSAPNLIMWVAAVFLTLMVHEMGHALIMRMYGIHSHIVLYAFGGVTVPVASYGNQPLRARDDALISFAGCGLELCFAAGVWCLFFFHYPMQLSGDLSLGTVWDLLWYPVELIYDEKFVGGKSLSYFLLYFYYISMVWSVLNLMPILPLDGGQIAREFFTWLWPRNGMSVVLMLSILIAVALAVLMIVLGMPFNALLFGMLAYTNFQQLSRPGY